MKLPEMSVIDTHLPSNYKIRGYTADQMIEYGKANAEAEREACADAVEDVAWKYHKLHHASLENIADECAAAIRARGTT